MCKTINQINLKTEGEKNYIRATQPTVVTTLLCKKFGKMKLIKKVKMIVRDLKAHTNGM